jgi:hypothetical protein
MFSTSVSSVRCAQIRHIQHDRTEAPDLVFGGHRTFLPRMRLAPPTVIDQHQPLALGILER